MNIYLAYPEPKHTLGTEKRPVSVLTTHRPVNRNQSTKKGPQFVHTLQNDRRVGNLNPARRGGQHHIGLFGLPGSGTRFHTVPAPAPVAKAKADDQPRRIGGMTAGQRRARINAWVAFGASVAPAAPASAVASAPVPCMDALMAKYRRTPAKQEPERDELFADTTARATPAMLACAAARDMREAFPHYYDDQEHAGFQLNPAAAGFIEATLVQEGY